MSIQSDYNVDLAKGIPFFTNVFDIVIHNAGLAHFYPRTKVEDNLFLSVNVNGTKNLIKGLENSGRPDCFVLISTVAVYGLIEGQDITEDYPLLAKDPYGQSKIEAENIVRSWCLANGIKLCILRLPIVAGKAPPGNLGSLVKAIKKGWYIGIEKGETRRSIVLAKDVASFIGNNLGIEGIFHLTDGIHPSYKMLEDAITHYLNLSPVYRINLKVAQAIAILGDFIPSFPLNSHRLNKLTCSLTFSDKKARSEVNWSSSSVLDQIHEILS